MYLLIMRKKITNKHNVFYEFRGKIGWMKLSNTHKERMRQSVLISVSIAHQSNKNSHFSSHLGKNYIVDLPAG